LLQLHTCFNCLFSCVLDISYLCCKSGSRCCICCYIAIHACFESIFQLFHQFQLYVANVSSLCFKSRLDVAHVAMCAGGWWAVAAWRFCQDAVVVHVWAWARFQMLALDAGGRWVQARSSIRTDAASGAGFGAGAKGVACIGHKYGSCVRTHCWGRTSGRECLPKSNREIF